MDRSARADHVNDMSSARSALGQVAREEVAAVLEQRPEHDPPAALVALANDLLHDALRSSVIQLRARPADALLAHAAPKSPLRDKEHLDDVAVRYARPDEVLQALGVHVTAAVR